MSASPATGRTAGLIYSLVSAVCFGMMAIIAKFAFAAGLSGPEILQYRFTFATGMLALVLLAKDRTLFRIPPRTLAKCLVLGSVGYASQSGLFLQTLRHLPASTTELLLYTYPVVVTLLSALIFKLRLTRTIGASLALVSLGAALVFHDAFTRSLDPVGLMYGLAVSGVFSGYLLCVQTLLKGEKPLRITFYVVMGAALAYNVINGPEKLLEMTPERIRLGLLLGLVPTTVAASLLYLAIERIGSAHVSIFSSLEPVATIAAASLLLGEEIGGLQWAGVACIVGGIVLPNALTLLSRPATAPGPERP
jgi:drug/metabolite transporter (DMT)-like permease